MEQSLSTRWRELIKYIQFSSILPQEKVLVPHEDVALLSVLSGVSLFWLKPGI